MNTPDSRTRWQNGFIYALLTTVMVLSSATLVSGVFGAGQRELAARVDRNSAVAVTAADAIICIMQLGVGPDDPPRSRPNVDRCLVDNGYLDIPTVQHGPGEE